MISVKHWELIIGMDTQLEDIIFQVLKDNHYYSSNEYYETQKYKSEYIILIYENDVLNTGTAEHLKDCDSLTFIIDIERYEEMNYQNEIDNDDYY